MHRENMQTPCRDIPGQESNPGPSCWTTVQPTILPPLYKCIFLNKIYIFHMKQNLFEGFANIFPKGCHNKCGEDCLLSSSVTFLTQFTKIGTFYLGTANK
ncbi:hypothetical protein ILYODFUR_025062 [Ilyodon furcidens]|uniref:Uncharacterized protein n=1 Tax=Ilyodon furcidens TaxID=33524 RepID=A0ABV0UIX1_9TELE